MTNQSKEQIIANCLAIKNAYEQGQLGSYEPAESIAPVFQSDKHRLTYYTLPMALNYRRPSHQLWQSAKQTYEDKSTYDVFDLEWVAKNYTSTELQSKLTKYKLALQPTRHTANWQTIASAIIHEWQSIEGLLKYSDYDFLILKDIVQKKYKKSFPYLSGPKLFNFWCYILTEYCQVTFINQRHIDIAVDSHVKKASLLLGVISEQQCHNLPTDQIATRWREVLDGSPPATNRSKSSFMVLEQAEFSVP